MIVISSDLVLPGDTATGDGSVGNSPMIGWHNQVAVDNVTATTGDGSVGNSPMIESELAGFPARNVANPLTYSEWRAAVVDDHYLTHIVPSLEPIDYVGIARHNFGSGQIAVSIEGTVADPDDDDEWFELVQGVLFADDAPIIFQFELQGLRGVRVRMLEGTLAPRVAVLYVGKLLRLPRNIYVGHAPVTLSRKTNVVTGKSATGNYLGRVVLGQFNESAANLKNLNPGWYRTRLDPFVRSGEGTPFFFAWRPQDYPNEVGYVWLTSDPAPSNQSPNGMMQVDLAFRGIVA